MIFDILEEKLRRSFLLVPGESLFREYMPPECHVGAMTKIPLSGIDIDPHIENWYRGRIQIITRHTDPEEGGRLANKVAGVLRVISPEDYPPSAERGKARISIFFPETLPIRFPRLSGNGYEWSQHFKTTFSFVPLT